MLQLHFLIEHFIKLICLVLKLNSRLETALATFSLKTFRYTAISMYIRFARQKLPMESVNFYRYLLV